MVLGFMGGMNRGLLSSKLLFGVLLFGRIVPSAFQSWEEIVQKDTLSWLDFSPLTLRYLFLLLPLSRGVFRSAPAT